MSVRCLCDGMSLQGNDAEQPTYSHGSLQVEGSMSDHITGRGGVEEGPTGIDWHQGSCFLSPGSLLVKSKLGLPPKENLPPLAW